MSRILYRLGHFSGRHPWRVLAAWLVIVATVFLLNGSIGGSPDETFRLPGAESQRAADLIQDRFPQQTIYTSNVIFHAEDGLTTPASKAQVADAVRRLAQGKHVLEVSDPYDPRGPTVSKDGTTAFSTIAFNIEHVKAAQFTAAAKATKAARDAGIQVEYDGDLGMAKGEAAAGSEQLGIAVAVIVLAISFGSLVAMSLPIVVALIGLLTGLSGIGILSGSLAMPQIATIVATMMGLGVGIDYALFVLARHRQNLEAGMPVPDAVARANATAGLSVLFAGTTVVVAIAGLQVSGVPMMTMMGWASALMVLIVMLASVTLLPAMLGVAGKRVNSLRLPFVKRHRANNPQAASARWTARVVAKPKRYGVVAAIVLGVLAAPVFSMHLGFLDAGNDDPSTTTRKAYDLMADGYGPGSNGPFSVVIDTKTATDDDAIVARVSAALKKTPGIVSVDVPRFNEAKDVAIIGATPSTSPQDARTSALVRTLRHDVIPAALGDSKATVSVTGSTPFTDDISRRLQDRMPWFLGAVIGLSFLVLLLVFRSVLVPLKAALLNVLSVGAAYGVVVAVFQWGWGSSLIGVHENVPIMPLAPMLMFAILFGLSMDYEVFLISRVRERFLRHGEAKTAVVEGVGSTARVITSAALIMIFVFGSFILDPDIVTKMFGVGLAVAVLIDVTLVRMILVPAAMSLLGDKAWWLPRWLDRIIPTIELEGSDADEQEEIYENDPRDDERELAYV